jgi:TonB family protein
MTPRLSQAPGAFETPRLAVQWQGRRTNFLESLHAALLGPRASREFDPAKSFFRLQLAPGHKPGRGIVGSFLWHALLLAVLIPLSRMAPPKTRLALPQIQIVWYGPETNVAPLPAPKLKKPKLKARPRPKPKPQPVVARAYNPKTTVIFKPPHPTSRRQVLIEPDAPPEMPKLTAGLPNVIHWMAALPARPEMNINPAQIFARRLRQGSAEAALRAPNISYATPPPGPIEIAPNPAVIVMPPLPIAPSAIHALRAASPRTAAAIAPSLSPMAPAAGPLEFAAGPKPVLLPPTPKEVRARRRAVAARNVTAPNLKIKARRLVALSLAPGKAPLPPGNSSAPISIGPHVGRKVSAAERALAANRLAGAGAPGIASANAVRGPAGLLILHNSTPAPVAPPPPARTPKRTSPLPRIAPVAPPSVRSELPTRRMPNLGSRAHLTRPSLMHRVLGPWRIHTLLMNMPDLTSSSGSWVLNFASPLPLIERNHIHVIAPLPLHAVDPGYPPELKEEGIEGTVILFAVIDRDGSVSQIRVLQSLNPVLDHNAEVAFSHWKFDPALLNNKPINLKVIVTVPFRYSETH